MEKVIMGMAFLRCFTVGIERVAFFVQKFNLHTAASNAAAWLSPLELRLNMHIELGPLSWLRFL
jgi:hypothetical protein